MAKIQIYGGRARTGSILIQPFSEEAKKSCVETAAFISGFPKMAYGTDWGKDWEDNNLGFIGKSAMLLGGGEVGGFGSGIVAQITGMITSKISPMIQMLAGPDFKPPIMSDSWTQLSAQLDEAKSYIDFDLELTAFPVTRRGSVHVEGLQGDPENLNQALNMGSIECSNMWDWLELGRVASMPEHFSSAQIKDNLVSMMNNLNGESGASGKMIIDGLDQARSSLWTGVTGSWDKASIESAGKGVVQGIGTALTGLSGANKRIGYSFTVQIFDCDGKRVFNSKNGFPLDFYMTGLSFDFSPHLVRLVDSQGARRGTCPEWCKISMRLSSSTRVTPNQIISMCEWQKD